MKAKFVILLLLAGAPIIFFNCTTSTDSSAAGTDSTQTSSTQEHGGYASQTEWGKHLVTITGCGDCHTPKKMTAQGPQDDADRFLAGASNPPPLPPVTPDQVAKGTAATVDETAWIGPWGKSYAANITSDSTGIGSWTEAQFINCLRKGKYMGLDSARPLMPPMPWRTYSQMTDDEIKAVFAYLKSTKPVHNISVPYEPPVMAKR